MFVHPCEVEITFGPVGGVRVEQIDLGEVMLRRPVPRTVVDKVNRLEGVSAAHQFDLKLHDVGKMASIATTVFLEYHGTRIRAIEEAPLLTTGHPLLNLLTIDVVRVILVERWFGEVDHVHSLTTTHLDECVAKCGFPYTVWT